MALEILTGGEEVKKIDINITLIANNEKQEYSVIGEYDNINNSLSYQEKTLDEITVTLNLNENRFIRDNKDYRLECYFELNSTTNNILLLKDLNKTLEIQIKTTLLKNETGIFEVSYLIIDSNELINYKIKY